MSNFGLLLAANSDRNLSECSSCNDVYLHICDVKKYFVCSVLCGVSLFRVPNVSSSGVTAEDSDTPIVSDLSRHFIRFAVVHT